MRFLLRDRLFRHGSVMFVGTTLSGVLNYIYQVYMGRALGPEQYGVFGALFAIFYMTTLISQTLNTSAARFAAELAARGHALGGFLRGGLKRMLLMGGASAALALLLLNTITSMLKISDVEPVLVLAVLLFLLWLRPIAEGALRGLQRFGALSTLLISSSAARFATGVPLVMMGAGVAGALAGIAFGQLVPVLLALFLLRGHLRSAASGEFSFSAFYSYSLPVLVAMLCFSVPANLDVVLAKYFFSAKEAGLYTSASVLGKISFFFPSAIYAVMFPMIAEAHVRGRRAGGILARALLYTGMLSGGVAFTYLLFPGAVLSVFGSGFAEAMPLVAPYGFAMLFFSLTSVLMQYHLAVKNLGYAGVMLAFTLLEVALLLLSSASPLALVRALMLSNLLLLLASVAYTIHRLRR